MENWLLKHVKYGKNTENVRMYVFWLGACLESDGFYMGLHSDPFRKNCRKS